MTVRIADRVIHLEGRCLVDDAEPLLLALQANSEMPVDLEHAGRLHLSVVQILLAIKPAVMGNAKDPIVAQFLMTALMHRENSSL